MRRSFSPPHIETDLHRSWTMNQEDARLIIDAIQSPIDQYSIEEVVSVKRSSESSSNNMSQNHSSSEDQESSEQIKQSNELSQDLEQLSSSERLLLFETLSEWERSINEVTDMKDCSTCNSLDQYSEQRLRYLLELKRQYLSQMIHEEKEELYKAEISLTPERHDKDCD